MPVNIGQREHSFAEPLGLLTDCHRRIEQFLDILLKIAELAQGGPLDSSTRSALNAAIVYFRDAAPKHIADEEESLFPRMKQCGGCSAALNDLVELEVDHAKLNDLHADVENMAMRWMRDDRLAEDEKLRFGSNLESMKRIYDRHIDVEERQVFHAAKSFLTEGQLQSIGREMAERRANFHRP
jgi:hemerythrin-like domain-containing protein